MTRFPGTAVMGEQRRPRKRRAFLAAILVAVTAGVTALLPASSTATEQRPSIAPEYDLKAAFLFNFAQFVEWPAEAFAAANTPITIGVLGDDPFGPSLDALVAGETIRSRALVIRRYRTVEEVEACHILFISSSEASQMDHISKALSHRSILTVGESKDFAARAGIIGFELSQRRLRLSINLRAANDARLTISSKLLRQAQIVKSSAGRP